MRLAHRREREERGKEAREAAERDLLKTMTPAQRVLWEREHPKQVGCLPPVAEDIQNTMAV